MYFRQDKHRLILKCIKGGQDKNVSTWSIMNYKCVCIISFIFSKLRSTTQNHSFHCRGDFHALVETASAYFFYVSEGELINRPLKIKNHVTRIRSEISCFWALELFCCFCKRSFHWNFVPYIWYKKRSSFLVLGQRLFSCNVLKKLGISYPQMYKGGGGVV